MLKIRALNHESSSDDDAAPSIRKEAQEEIALDMYNKALRLQCSDNLDEALDILHKLLDENIPQLESQGGLPKTMSTIKYSCYINIGSILMEKGDMKMALDHFLLASELDKTDVTLWYKIGMLALKADRFRQAAYAFLQGLNCNESHWPCLDQLISVLFAIKDTIACLEFIGKALILDPYYTKGVVLRKNIYENNPATEEYYKLFNPNHIHEPCVEMDISEVDETAILDEVQKLCEQINLVEKALLPKPLPTIPLPTPLEDFTWLALGKTLTGLHKYISDNNMSHLSKINLKKCMSQRDVTLVVETQKIDINVETEPVRNSEVDIEDQIVKADKVVESTSDKECEKMETDEIVERRMSQNSDNDGGDYSATPNQTDDNEEMEQDMEDAEESINQKRDSTRPMTKGIKRKRDLVSDLQIWGWHSKRKATKRGKNEKDFTIEDALTRIIPTHLLPNGISSDRYNSIDDSMSTMDLYNMHVEENKMEKMLSPIGSPSSDIERLARYGILYSTVYFGSEKESEDVKRFWSRGWENCDAIDLIEEYVYAVSEIWNTKWPEKLISVYIDAYNMFREHCSHPPLFSSEVQFETLRKDALATILYGELTTYINKKHFSDNEIHCTSVSHLMLLSAWDVNWDSEYTAFAMRVHWLRAQLFLRKNENTLAITALQVVQDLINSAPALEGSDKQFKLFLPNCLRRGVLTSEVIDELLANLELIDSLSRLEDLFENKHYVEVATILKTTFKSSVNHTTCGKMGRPAQLGLLMHSLWFTDMIDCFVWTEECLNESLTHYVKSSRCDKKWEMVLDKCLLILYEIIKTETVSVVDSLSDVKRNRLVESLSILCGRQINCENVTKIPLNSVVPWILLHYVLLRDEHRQQAKKVVKHVQKDDKCQQMNIIRSEEEEEVPPSLSILFSAHEFLGPRGWCLTNQGEVLHFMLDTIIYRLDTPIFESIREKIDIHLEQAFFCLYQHPCKKNKVSRHLADHNVNPLPLTWSRAQQLYEFFCPDALPEFDSYKSISITSELEQLLQRLTAIVPKECDPQPLLPNVRDYINGTSNVLPNPIDFPLKTRAMYYLLGDYFFKQSEVKRSYKYFLLDLCINPRRIDTWAGLALGIHSQLESKLNHCERFKTEMEFIEKAKSARICFQEALKLNNSHITLWIEFGSFEYMVHSFCSRVLKYESDTLSMEKFEILETEKESYLESSQKSFQQAQTLHRLDQVEIDERWLYHYMLAKVAEKKQEDPNVYLQHYMTAASLLHENNCTYPDKINYNNPQHLSLEALEVHYRINASILKYLELHEGKVIPASVGKLFKKCLDSSMIQKSKYECKTPVKTDEIKPTTAESTKQSDKISDDVKTCMNDVLTKVVNNINNEKDFNVAEVVIIDSDDEKKKEEPVKNVKVTDVQEIMDQMMKETMAKQAEVPFDSDLDSNLINEVVLPPAEPELKSDNTEVKIATEEPKSDEKLVKSGDEPSIRKSTEDSSSSSSASSSSSSSDSESDDSSSSSSSSSDNSNENMSETEITNLVDRCIVGLEHCIRRLPQNYKALYRLSHLHFSYSKKKDLSKCKQLLLSEYKCKNSVLVSGLFSDRKTSNFFNGIWRIPSSEIDRPGSLAAHMGRCVSLLLQVLRDTNDHRTLLELCLQLKRTPDADKVYIRNCEREQLSEQALTMCLQSLRTQIKNIDSVTPAAAEKLLVDIFRAYQKSQKNLVHQEKVFAGMLIEAYKILMGDKASDNNVLLELATKYCQQSRLAEKLKKQQQAQAAPKIPMLSAMPPVMPSPSTITSPLQQPLKRPTVGRPRGRPPGPKLHGQSRVPRGRSPMPQNNPYSWQNNPMYNTSGYDYFKQYQDELLRQYSQMQLNQLNQSIFANAGMLNPTSTAASMLNPTSLVQTMQQMNAGINTLAANQLSQSLSQLNPSLLKKISSQLAVPTNTQMMNNYISEKLKHLSSMGQTPPKTSKSLLNKPKHPGGFKSNLATTSSFKYPPAEISKKVKDVTKTSTSLLSSKTEIPKAHSSKQQSLVIDKTTNLMKDRPNISITPVTQTTNATSTRPSISASPGKTLQEKLADKQKQQKSVAKGLDFAARSAEQKSFPPFAAHGFKQNLGNLGQGFPQIPKTLDVIPNYLMESGISISQVSSKAAEITAVQPKHKPKPLSGNPISMSVIRKPEDVHQKKPDDDVIIIE